jgi:hypothetical protein
MSMTSIFLFLEETTINRVGAITELLTIEREGEDVYA